VIALVGLLAALPIELELAGGAAFSREFEEPPPAPCLKVRAAVHLLDYLAMGASLLGVPGSEPQRRFCGSPCRGNASFKAIAGFASLRLHSTGDFQMFAEGGLGIGHLISLSSDDLFEDPPLRGRGGPAYLAGGGARLFVARNVALGLELAWTKWTKVEQAAHQYGVVSLPAQTDLTASALLLLFSINYSLSR
jgi:hypothetical protein